MIIQGKATKVIGVVLMVYVLVAGCAQKMSGEDFAKVTKEWGLSLIDEVLKDENWNKSLKEKEKLAYRKLDEVCKKYGYSAKDYKRKAKELGKKVEEEWRTLWEDFDNH